MQTTNPIVQALHTRGCRQLATLIAKMRLEVAREMRGVPRSKNPFKTLTNFKAVYGRDRAKHLYTHVEIGPFVVFLRATVPRGSIHVHEDSHVLFRGRRIFAAKKNSELLALVLLTMERAGWPLPQDAISQRMYTIVRRVRNTYQRPPPQRR